jgi:hypothetical protein
LGNDVLHDDWREVLPGEYEDAHKYTQRILEDFYDDRPTVEARLALYVFQNLRPHLPEFPVKQSVNGSFADIRIAPHSLATLRVVFRFAAGVHLSWIRADIGFIGIYRSTEPKLVGLVIVLHRLSDLVQHEPCEFCRMPRAFANS